MKFSTTLILALFISTFIGCKNQETNAGPPTQPQPAAPSNSLNNTATASGIQHYTCPNNDGGGNATSGTCPICGAELVHNQAFHDQGVTAPSNAPVGNANAGLAAGGVQHYTCPNNDGGGSGNAGNCSICGTALVHNQAFHNQGGATAPASPNDGGALSPLFQTSPGAAQQQQLNVPATSPAANAGGVYHYVCGNGCAGGSGTAGNCATCGTALVHNQAYHN